MRIRRKCAAVVALAGLVFALSTVGAVESGVNTNADVPKNKGGESSEPGTNKWKELASVMTTILNALGEPDALGEKDASPFLPPGQPDDRPPGEPPGQTDPPNPPGKPDDRPPDHANNDKVKDEKDKDHDAD